MAVAISAQFMVVSHGARLAALGAGRLLPHASMTQTSMGQDQTRGYRDEAEGTEYARVKQKRLFLLSQIKLMAVPARPLSKLRKKRVVVLPDLYIDALVPVGSWNHINHDMNAVVKRGGGTVPVGPPELRVGGNAANLALGLAMLGVQVSLAARTNELGAHLLQHAARGIPLDMSLLKIGPDAGCTIALESDEANVMLSNPGPLVDFTPQSLDAATWSAIESADAVAVTNWSQNPHGTALTAAIAQRMDESEGLLYIDTGDPRHRMDEAPEFLADRRIWDRITAWGLNDNEALAFATAAGLVVPPDDSGQKLTPSRAAQALAMHLGIRIDLHTRVDAASFDAQGDSHREPLPDEAPVAKRLTGAGDAWNAGNLAGYLLEWSTSERLCLAHQTATMHVASDSIEVPVYP